LINQYEDEDGLISTQYIVIRENKLFIDNIEVEEIFELHNLVAFIRKYPFLWENLKLKLEKKTRTVRSSAPIVNIPFDKAIDLIISGKRNLSPRFRIDIEYSKNAIFGILLANFKKVNSQIYFQLWQIYRIDQNDIDIPTNYIHGIFDIQENCFIHFDGALIMHDEESRRKIEQGIIPEKNFPYLKLFRLDCRIEKDIAKTMMAIYLPVEELNEEFGLYITNLESNKSLERNI